MGQAPDVRVRLSAEGVQEVIAAFKQIQAQANSTQKAAASGAKGMSALSSAASTLGAVLPAISFAAIIGGMVSAVKGALQLADGMGKLSQKTGFTVDTLSTLSFAARTADVDQEKLAGSLQKATKFFFEYDTGATKAKEAVQQLFGSQGALKGMDDDTRLLKVVDALAKLAPGAKRSGLAMQFFGKSGAELLPLIDDLGNGGFDKLRAKAEKLGLVMNKDLAKAAQQANDAFTDMESAAKGMAVQFASGFAPALADSAEALVDVATGGGDGFKTLGEVAGDVLRVIIALVASVILDIQEMSAQINSLALRSVDLVRNIAQGNVRAGWKQFVSEVKDDSTALDAEMAKKRARLDKLLNPTKDSSTGADKRDRSGADDLEQRQRAQRSRIALLNAQDESSLEKTRADQGRILAVNQAMYDEGLRDLESYLNRRRLAVEMEYGQEQALIQAQIERLKSLPLQEKETADDRQKQIEELNKRLYLAETHRLGALEQIDRDETKLKKGQTQQELEWEQQKAQMAGNTHAAEMAALEAQIAAMQRLKGETDEAFAARQGAVRTSGTNNIQFADLKRESDALMNSLGSAEAEIQAKVQAGILTQLEGEQQIATIEQARLPIIQEIAQGLLAAAQATSDPQKVADAQALNDRLRDMAVTTANAGNAFQFFRSDVDNALKSDLSNWFTQGIDSAEGFGDAMRGLASSVVGSLRQIAANILSTMLTAKLLKGLGGLGLPGFSGGGQVGSGAGGMKLATGGHVRGWGTTTSDSIPAWLSNGEFVVRAAVVQQPGMLQILKELNTTGLPALRRRGAPRFADGGLVDVSAGRAAGIAGASLQVALDEGLVLRNLEKNSEFARVIVRTAEANKKKLNSALGRGAQ